MCPERHVLAELCLKDLGKLLFLGGRQPGRRNDIGGNLVFAAVSAFVLFYFTDIAGIGAAIAEAFASRLAALGYDAPVTHRDIDR